jgi:putative tricarboxylic transport membrane protein
MIMSQGSLAIFWSNPLVASLMAIGLVVLLGPVSGRALGRFRRGAGSEVCHQADQASP